MFSSPEIQCSLPAADRVAPFSNRRPPVELQAAAEHCSNANRGFHQIRSLEAWLGVRCSAPATESRLTDCGERLFRSLQGPAASQSVVHCRWRSVGNLTSTTPAFAALWLVPRLPLTPPADQLRLDTNCEVLDLHQDASIDLMTATSTTIRTSVSACSTNASRSSPGPGRPGRRTATDPDQRAGTTQALPGWEAVHAGRRDWMEGQDPPVTNYALQAASPTGTGAVQFDPGFEASPRPAATLRADISVDGAGYSAMRAGRASSAGEGILRMAELEARQSGHAAGWSGTPERRGERQGLLPLSVLRAGHPDHGNDSPPARADLCGRYPPAGSIKLVTGRNPGAPAYSSLVGVDITRRRLAEQAEDDGRRWRRGSRMSPKAVQPNRFFHGSSPRDVVPSAPQGHPLHSRENGTSGPKGGAEASPHRTPGRARFPGEQPDGDHHHQRHRSTDIPVPLVAPCEEGRRSPR